MFKRILALIILIGLVAAGAPAQKKKAKGPSKGAQYEYEKAVISMKYGLEDESVKYLNQAIAMDPKHADSYKLLGVIQFRKKNYAESVAAFEKYLELKPDDSEALANLGYGYESLGQPDKAEETYKKAIAVDENAGACFGLAKLYLTQKKLPEAQNYAQRAVANNPKSAAAHNLLGVVLNQMSKFPEAAASFEEALKITPDDLNLSINLGVTYINGKEYAKARELYEKILPKIEDPALKEKIEGYLKLIKERAGEEAAEPIKQRGDVDPDHPRLSFGRTA
jgi:Flp pilus assembly protein TadD